MSFSDLAVILLLGIAGILKVLSSEWGRR